MLREIVDAIRFVHDKGIVYRGMLSCTALTPLSPPLSLLAFKSRGSEHTHTYADIKPENECLCVQFFNVRDAIYNANILETLEVCQSQLVEVQRKTKEEGEGWCVPSTFFHVSRSSCNFVYHFFYGVNQISDRTPSTEVIEHFDYSTMINQSGFSSNKRDGTIICPHGSLTSAVFCSFYCRLTFFLELDLIRTKTMRAQHEDDAKKLYITCK